MRIYAAFQLSTLHISSFGTGKTSFFVANQSNLEEMPPEQRAVLEAERVTLEGENQARAVQIKALTSGK